jgi:sulfate permease, SulP family
VAFVYRLPIPVQPLKAFAAIAIAEHMSPDEIGASALLLGVTFVVLGRTGVVDLVSRVFPRPLVRAIQLAVGLLFLKVAWGLVAQPPVQFRAHALPVSWGIPIGAVLLLALLSLRRVPVSLVVVAIGSVVAVVTARTHLGFGPSHLRVPSFSLQVLWTVLPILVIPQLPLSFANSCLATADAARSYFGDRAAAITPGRLATTFGTATVLAGLISGMPVCHGAGGLSAHYRFGARRAAAPALMGVVLLVLAVGFGSGLAPLLAAFPLPILAGLLASAGVLHIGLLRDLSGVGEWTLAVAIGVLGFATNLAVALGAGLAVWWLVRGGLRLRRVLQAPA